MPLFSLHKRAKSNHSLAPSTFSTHEKSVSFFSFSCVWQIPQLRQLYGDFLAKQTSKENFLFLEASTEIQQCILSLVHRTRAAQENGEEQDFFSCYHGIVRLHEEMVCMFLRPNSLYLVNASDAEKEDLLNFDWNIGNQGDDSQINNSQIVLSRIEKCIQTFQCYLAIIEKDVNRIVYLLESDTFPRFAKSDMLNNWLVQQNTSTRFSRRNEVLRRITEIDREKMYSISQRDFADYISMLSNDDSLWKIHVRKKNTVQYKSTRAGQFGGRMFKTRATFDDTPQKVIVAQFMPHDGYESSTLEHIPSDPSKGLFATLINYTLIKGKIALFPTQDFVVRTTSYTYRDEDGCYHCMVLALAIEYPVMPRRKKNTRLTGNTAIYVRGRGPTLNRNSSCSHFCGERERDEGRTRGCANEECENSTNQNSKTSFDPSTSPTSCSSSSPTSPTSPYFVTNNNTNNSSTRKDCESGSSGTELVMITDYRLSDFGIFANMIGSFLGLAYLKMLRRSMKHITRANITIENVHEKAVHPDMMNLMTKKEYLSLSKPII